MEKWLVYAKKADFGEWARELNVDPVVARLIRNRDVETLEEAKKFLNGTIGDCHSPGLLKDIDPVVDELIHNFVTGERVRVIGDYDVDGICSSYILYRGISANNPNVDVAIPHRIRDGYGLNENLIREAYEDGVKLIITCDNGISAAEPVRLARELGMKVIVTDHHEVPFVMEGDQRRDVLPEALAVIDPKRSDETYPFPGICGAVVAYKVMEALAIQLDRMANLEDHFAQESFRLSRIMGELLEFAAMATVCDVMELKDENRIIVKEGLKRIHESENPGLRALIEVNGLEPDKIASYHLGFVLGPCLNATGRLDTAERALELLMPRTEASAVSMARDLKELNDSRKNLTLQGVELAQKIIEENHLDKDKVLVVYVPEVHESLAGIIAGRIREQYGHPAIVLTKGEEGVKGSGRSVEAYNMFEELSRVKDLLPKFGGHKMAAGLSLEEENVEELRRRLNENCTLTEEDFIPCIHVDVPMPMEYVTMDLVRQIDLLEPFGVGNPKPLFAQKDIVFLEGSRMGKTGQYGRFLVKTPGGSRIKLTYFGNVEDFFEYLDEKYGQGSSENLLKGRGDYSMMVAYQIGINAFHGKEEIQFLMKSYQ